MFLNEENDPTDRTTGCLFMIIGALMFWIFVYWAYLGFPLP